MKVIEGEGRETSMSGMRKFTKYTHAEAEVIVMNFAVWAFW